MRLHQWRRVRDAGHPDLCTGGCRCLTTCNRTTSTWPQRTRWHLMRCGPGSIAWTCAEAPMMTDAAPPPAPTSSQASPPTPQAVRRLQRRQDRRRIAVQQRQELARARKAAEEARAEQLAPQVQRNDVLDAAGRMVRGARLVKDGVTFVRSNSIQHL